MAAREVRDWCRTAGGRLTLGTGLLLHGAGDWLAPEDAGAFLARTGGTGIGLIFAGHLLDRAPHMILAVPIAWAIGAWRMSETSPTPPPGSTTPLDDEQAGHSLADGTTLGRQKGMLIYSTPDPHNPQRTHVEVEVEAVREEVTDQ